MDKRFIDSAIDAYFLDNNIYESTDVTREIYSNKLLEDLRLLREEELEIYDEIYNTTRICQNRIVRNYLDSYFVNESEDVLEEIGVGVTEIAAILSAGLLYRYNAPITNAIFSTINTVAKQWLKFTTWLSKAGGTTRVRYAIIKRNTERCYKDCKVNPKDASLGHYAGTSKNLPAWGLLSNPDRLEAGTCLRNCRIEEMIESLNLLMENYFTCLKNSGIDLRDAENDIMKFIARTDVSNVCKGFYDQAKLAFNSFEQTVNLMFQKEDEKDKQKYYNDLREKLYQTRQKVERKPQQFQRR